MNKFLLFSFLIPAIAGFSACTSDSPEVSNGSELQPVRFSLKLGNMVDSDTRSLAPDYRFGDGKSVSILRCYIYNQANGSKASPVKVMNVNITQDADGNRGGDVSILLPKGQNFDIVFLATSIEQTDKDAKLCYSATDRTISLDYSKIAGNDEEIDCFYAACQDVTTDYSADNAVELKRPFAQINIGTQDYAEYSASNPVKDIAVAVDGVYNSVSVMTGDPVGPTQKVNFYAAGLPDNSQVFPKSGYKYLSMNYVLVNLRSIVSVEMTVNHSNGTAPKVLPFSNVAVERNYQTNIYAQKLLTEYSPE